MFLTTPDLVTLKSRFFEPVTALVPVVPDFVAIILILMFPSEASSGMLTVIVFRGVLSCGGKSFSVHTSFPGLIHVDVSRELMSADLIG